MEEVYAAMLLHKAGKEINESGVKKILEAADVKVNDAKVKALVASLEGVDIQKAIEEAVVAAPAASAPSAGQAKEEVKEEKNEEEEKKSSDEAAAGLSSLFS